MDHKTFEQLVDNRLAQCKETLCAKREEYFRNEYVCECGGCICEP